ncbi:uncharacterized protein LOC111663570 [Seriola lalandi dorsalis]|uniref:uncharacterized protein LOC111663570 n=1 Tax=Seriola lalandi dorsalis TaxID=1841481 RepID=UPI000C6FC055|nr:uncharacterized protein LOC111663570 [Seriola lalandi dorsalis]XP_023273571.1 uncharacterized protein LOC111663570 [Seriola lalandi dorsalis]XP_023273572.1 uncharacterized protein LOC111663570 [Seriola lalandi dorsalis]
MHRAMSCRSVGQQQCQLRELVQAVLQPLKKGLCSFNNVSEMLLSVNGDMVLPGSKQFRDIRQQIENMKQQMQASEEVAKTELQRLDWETEHLTAMQSDLARQKKKKEGELQNLKTKLESHRSSLASYREALETEKRNLVSAEDTLSSMRRRRDEAETMRNVGIGLMFIPFVGWIPGATLAIIGESEMNEASDAVRTAKREVNSCESQVESYSDKVSKYESQISQAQRDIKETDNKIHETDAKLRDMSVQRQVVADFQNKMRRAVHQLGKLSGVGSVAELQTRHQILLAPVIRVMEEMTTALSQITGDELLHTQGIKTLIWDMKRNHNKLKELPGTSETLNDYY